MRKASTIYDIAKKARVAPSTVSRALGGSHSISKATINKIREIAEELNYIPNTVAQALVGNKTNTISLFFHTFSDTFSEDPILIRMLDGVYKEAKKSGYYLNFAIFPQEVYETEVIAAIKSACDRSDGTIIVTNNLPYKPKDMFLSKPVIFTDQKIEGEDCVIQDNFGCIYDAADYLCKLGHKRIGIIETFQEFQTVLARVDGYTAAVKDNNIAVDTGLIHRVSPDSSEIIKACDNLISQKADALIVFDMYTETVMSYLKLLNVNIPDNLSVIIYADMENIRYEKEGYTHILSQRELMGKVSVERIVNLINGNYSDNSITKVKPLFIEGTSVRKC